MTADSARRRRLAGTVVLPALTAFAGVLAAGGSRLVRRRAVNANVVIGTAAAVGTAAVALAERLAPFDPEWIPDRRTRRTDLAYMLVSGPPVAAGAAACASAVGNRVADDVRRRFGRTPWPSTWPAPARFALAIVVSEFVHYWHHRASHQVGALWRFHAVHHSATEMSWANSFRFHPLDHVTLLAAQSMALLALGMDDETLVSYSIFKGIHGQIQHGNVGARSGAMGLILSGADQHRWHHAATLEGRAVNHGAVLSVFDRMFGTHHLPPDAAPPATVGLGRAYPADWRGQFTQPFLSAEGSRTPVPSRGQVQPAGG